MNFPATLFSGELYWGAHLLYLLLMGWAIYSAPWHMLRSKENLNVLLGATVALMVLWSLKAGIRPGMNFHLIGATLLMLMFGWQFALFSLSLVLVGQGLYGNIEWFSYSLNALMMGGGPVLFSYAIYRFSQRYLPKHFFVYTLFNAFFCAALTMGLLVAVTSFLLNCCGGYSWDDIYYRYLPFAPLIIFAEAFFTGMLATSMVLFRPDWIGSFDDRRYLHGK
ncbi:MAG: energy-coupling factor ABC transporter permease [Gammaproteobacteria bacterium]|nr:energy-coupling factor ABC transporter permease [Gammaproteobacteria bacterium]MCW8841314.1 energy-coupling factor ABC transporter permease [Gammaproteobacteria bacterium]MCW8927413.1 energy-coupling factor ABC transporter permease [Gammaproteobacteria bacterium]MCW8958457.1 energy-coupling factor ABC transporter permease [Gammaproteobacteria bacterium]MCW8971797.1 energy-coupling factor ABC transporter permease [Gammaproteobacteria bacterium]